MSKKEKIFILILLIPVLLWVCSLLKCEVLTAIYGKEIKECYQKSEYLQNAIGEIDYFKILNRDGDEICVYFVTKEHKTAEIVIFEKNEEVKVERWARTVWSGCGGSASEVIWPYWWHFIYGGL